ncbi:MAG: putative lipid II flippase FtsW [Holosporaceae bacterium]|jgi:cell division protein FtsW|nr:putative lipid II flippase FtsW [Holosporaceae bacterium]
MISRASDSVWGKWWWSVDKAIFFAFLTLIAVGILLAGAATPMVADRLKIEKFYFLKRHLLYIIPSLSIFFLVSLQSNSNIKKLSLTLFAVSVFLMALTPILGSEIKGARRWISFFGFSLQPSEFMRPSLVIITAWIFAEQQKHPEFHGVFLATFPLLLAVFLLICQPDIGMVVVTLMAWFSQLFINGLPLIFVAAIAAIGMGCLLLAYLFFPHVTARIDRFLDPSVGDQYQITRSLEAFSNGNFFGVGPGEGVVKKYIPDAHSDFVFAVLGEECGFIVCAMIVIIIAFIVVYGLIKAIKSNNLFILLSSAGLLVQFGIQAFINIASSLHIIPTKGISLPFMSYGGSSMIASGITMGMIFALRRNI